MALSIHLGAHKTASTHLQNSLRLAHAELLAGGVCLIDPVVLRRMDPPVSRVLADGEDSPLGQHFTQEIHRLRGDCRNVLMTEENILGGTHRRTMYSQRGVLYPGALRRVRQVIDLMDDGDATLFLSIRDAASFNVSAFALQVLIGNEIEIGAYLRGHDPARSAWGGLVQRLVSLPRVRRVVVWRYEDYRAVRPRLLARMLANGLDRVVPQPPPANESLTQQGYDWFLMRAMSDSEIDLRILAQRARNRFRREDGNAPLRLFGPEVYDRSARNYAAELDRIRNMDKVELLEP